MNAATNPDAFAFATARAALEQARRRAEQGRLDLFLAREKVKRIGAQEADLARVYDESNSAHRERRQQLTALRAEAEAAVSQLETAYAGLTQAAQSRLDDFAVFTDPREFIEYLSDATPFLLLPLRIETRFKKIAEATATRHQLWVRVYPDDVAVDTFEPILSDVEVANARNYWTETWRAGGAENRVRGAWRSLVASHGSGRAAWIVANYRPVGDAQPPVKAENGEIVVSDTMAGMFDFHRAVQSGMGFIVDLTAAQYRRGFDRLLVLGVRLDADETASQSLLERLLHNHHRSRSGFSLLPQGTPTNNTERAPASRTWTTPTPAMTSTSGRIACSPRLPIGQPSRTDSGWRNAWGSTRRFWPRSATPAAPIKRKRGP